MLAVTSAMADQASVVARPKNNPTEDFSAIDDLDLSSLADADAMAYFQSHKDLTFDMASAIEVGTAHAFKHGLLGVPASAYKIDFATALKVLTTKE